MNAVQRGVQRGAWRPAPSEPGEIHDGVEQENTEAEPELNPTRQSVRVDHRGDVVIDETAGVAGFAASSSERILERRQWADESHELDHGAVQSDGDVNPRQSSPAQREQPAEDDEQDEGEVEQEYQVGAETEEHTGNTALAHHTNGTSRYLTRSRYST